MGLNIRILHLVYITADKEHLGAVSKYSAKECNSITVPYEFHGVLIQHPFQIFTSIKNHLAQKSIRLSALIDYKSFLANKKDWKDFSTVIRDTILCFPEINFYFDERIVTGDNAIKDFLAYIVTGIGVSVPADLSSQVKLEIHSFSSEYSAVNQSISNSGGGGRKVRQNHSIFEDILRGKDNLFDASNLRFFLKELRYIELNLHRNYHCIQESRAKNLALCVEEERSQSLFNSVALFLNGFRVFPITSAGELYWANVNLKPQIIIRDYDLQFPDSSRNWAKLKKEHQKKEKNKLLECLAIHVIRGWRYNAEIKKWESYLTEDNVYWNHLLSTNTYYVSKGAQDKDGSQNLFLTVPKTKDDSKQQFVIGVGKKELHLPGIYKPVSGIYKPFQVVNQIKTRYDSRYDSNSKALPVITSRTDEGGHSVPLDIYNMVKNMVDRAEAYYEQKRFVHSIILANDAIEIMNGFHQALTIRAYRCQALAENAVAANILGGDEEALMKDTEFRLTEIEKEITRISSVGDKAGSLNVIRRRNTLNQIYNEIRIYCKEREHFDAEDSVIRAIGHLNQGFPICAFIRMISRFFKSFWLWITRGSILPE